MALLRRLWWVKSSMPLGSKVGMKSLTVGPARFIFVLPHFYTGKEVWQDKYETRGADGPAQSFAGPRACPAVADGKVVTLGVRGTLSCYDAGSGKVVWRKEDFKSTLPRFYTSCSPLLVDGLCIVQLGGENKG